MEQPDLGWTTPVKVERVIDGDTIEVSITRRFMVRLQDDDGDFDTPETYRPKSEEEKTLGLLYTDFVKKQLQAASTITMHVGAFKDGEVRDLFSIGTRINAHIFVDGEDLAEKVNNNKEKIESSVNE